MFYKYRKRYNYRFLKEQINIIYAKFLHIFRKNDREKIVDFAIKSMKYINIFPFLLFISVFIFLFLISSGSLNENILITGIFAIVLPAIYTLFKYRQVKLSEMKDEICLILNHKPVSHSASFLFKYLSIDLFFTIMVYASLPYIIIGTGLLSITTFNIGLFFLLLSFFVLSYALMLLFLIIKLFTRSQLIFDLFIVITLIIAITMVLQIVSLPANISDGMVEHFDQLTHDGMTAYSTYALIVNLVVIAAVLFIIRKIINSNSFFKMIFYKERNLNVNREYNTALIAKNFYRILLRERVLQVLSITYLLLSIMVIALYPLLKDITNIGMILVIVMFGYSPAIYNITVNFSIFAKILDKNALLASKYLLLKYNAVDYFIKNILMFSVKNTILFVLPFMAVLGVYQPPYFLLFALLYILLILLLLVMFIFRMFKIEDYKFNDIYTLGNSFIVSNGNENMIFLGIPIIYTMPLIFLYIANPNVWYPLLIIMGYSLVLFIYLLIKTVMRRRLNHAKGY